MLVKHNLPICQRQRRQESGKERERKGKQRREPLGAPAFRGGGEITLAQGWGWK